jgi:hypothetical protein
MTPKQLHDEMGKVVNRPGYPLLRFYRDDFESSDLRYLENAWHLDAKMLWVVRESGTHIVPLDIHPAMSGEGRAILNMAEPKEAFLLTRRGVEQIPLDQAARELGARHWSQDGARRVSKHGEPVADIVDIVHSREGNTRIADAKLHMIKPVGDLSLGDLVALRIYAERAAIDEAGTLFVGTRSVRVGASDLDQLLDDKRAAWLARGPDPLRGAASSRSAPGALSL